MKVQSNLSPAATLRCYRVVGTAYTLHAYSLAEACALFNANRPNGLQSAKWQIIRSNSSCTCGLQESTLQLLGTSKKNVPVVKVTDFGRRVNTSSELVAAHQKQLERQHLD